MEFVGENIVAESAGASGKKRKKNNKGLKSGAAHSFAPRGGEVGRPGAVCGRKAPAPPAGDLRIGVG